MTEQTSTPTQGHALADPVPAPPARRRPRSAAAALGLLIAVAAGSTGALAATMAHRSDPAPTPSPAVATGPTVYVPGAIGAAGGGVPGGAGASGGGVALGAPAVAAVDGVSSGASFSRSAGAGPTSFGGYPGAAWCSGSSPVQVTGREVTATGMSQLAGTQPASSGYSLWSNVGSQGSGDTARVVSAVQARLAAVTDALVRAGVPRGSIHTSTVSVYASSQRNGGPYPASTGSSSSSPTMVNANASLTATVADTSTLDRAVSAAAGAGADNVSASTQSGAVDPPAPDQVSAAISQATDQARALASAGAKAAGGTLGALHSVSAQPPAVCGWGQNGPQFVVAVTVSWDLA